MRFEFDPVQDGPKMAAAEALQKMAFQLKRIADALDDQEGSL